MRSFGERLRREREMRGVTLDEIATATKIGTRSLRALEQEDFGKLPGGIFNKGFVRAYAKFLGMDEEQAVADYVAAAGEHEQSDELVIEKLAAESERRADQKRIEEQRERQNDGPPFTWNTIAAIVFLAVVGVLGWQWYGRHRAAQAQSSKPAPVRAQQPAPAPPQTVINIPAPSAPPPQSTAQAAASNVVPKGVDQKHMQSTPGVLEAPRSQTVEAATSDAAQEFVVVVRANRASWLSSQADGDSRTQRTLQPNGEATFRARTNLKLVIGNAGGVEVSFNGKPLTLIAEENKSKTLVFTQDGLQ